MDVIDDCDERLEAEVARLTATVANLRAEADGLRLERDVRARSEAALTAELAEARKPRWYYERTDSWWRLYQTDGGVLAAVYQHGENWKVACLPLIFASLGEAKAAAERAIGVER